MGTLAVGMSDGSSTKRESLDKNGRAMTPRTGNDNKSEELVDMFVPTPSKYGWPPTAIIAPATQVNPEWKPNPSKRWVVLLSIGVVGILIVAMARRNMGESKGGSWSDEKEQAAPKS